MSHVTGTHRQVAITITGRVQGVWFRASTKSRADQLHLRGYVKNIADGSVYVEVRGRRDDVNALIEWCHQGPDLARVHHVSVSERPLSDLPAVFEVRRS